MYLTRSLSRRFYTSLEVMSISSPTTMQPLPIKINAKYQMKLAEHADWAPPLARRAHPIFLKHLLASSITDTQR
jgi:hypothetical protein